MTPTAGLKVLIADDHAGMRQTLRELLSPIASDIHEAADGEQAVRLFAAEQPDWVVMDVRMQPVNGLNATRAILRLFPTAKIIIVTQHDDADVRAEAARAGALAYVLKDNLAALTQLISRDGGSHRAVAQTSEASPDKQSTNQP